MSFASLEINGRVPTRWTSGSFLGPYEGNKAITFVLPRTFAIERVETIGKSVEISKDEKIINENSTFLYFCKKHTNCRPKNEEATVLSALYEANISLSINSTDVSLENYVECFGLNVELGVDINLVTDYILNLTTSHGLSGANYNAMADFLTNGVQNVRNIGGKTLLDLEYSYTQNKDIDCKNYVESLELPETSSYLSAWNITITLVRKRVTVRTNFTVKCHQNSK